MLHMTDHRSMNIQRNSNDILVGRFVTTFSLSVASQIQHKIDFFFSLGFYSACHCVRQCVRDILDPNFFHLYDDQNDDDLLGQAHQPLICLVSSQMWNCLLFVGITYYIFLVRLWRRKKKKHNANDHNTFVSFDIAFYRHSLSRSGADVSATVAVVWLNFGFKVVATFRVNGNHHAQISAPVVTRAYTVYTASLRQTRKEAFLQLLSVASSSIYLVFCFACVVFFQFSRNEDDVRFNFDGQIRQILFHFEAAAMRMHNKIVYCDIAYTRHSPYLHYIIVFRIFLLFFAVVVVFHTYTYTICIHIFFGSFQWSADDGCLCQHWMDWHFVA